PRQICRAFGQIQLAHTRADRPGADDRDGNPALAKLRDLPGDRPNERSVQASVAIGQQLRPEFDDGGADGAEILLARIAHRPYSDPFVLGTSELRGSALVAWRSALAVALKIASAMWWLFVP